MSDSRRARFFFKPSGRDGLDTATGAPEAPYRSVDSLYDWSAEDYGLPHRCIDCEQMMETLDDWEEHEPCRYAHADYVERWSDDES
jgi:hypothetical protein